MPACWEFISFNIFFVIVAYVLLKWGFKLLFNYRISILLRPFSSLILIGPALLDGNLQYFCFLLFTQISMGFSLNPRDKMLNVLNYLIYFVIIWVSVVSSFLCYYLNKKLTKFVIDYWRTKINGLLAFSLVNTVRHLVMGALHSLLRSHSLQLPLLLGTEVVYMLFLLMMMKYWKTTKVAYRVWFTCIFIMLRVFLLIVLIVMQSVNPEAGSAEEANNGNLDENVIIPV